MSRTKDTLMGPFQSLGNVFLLGILLLAMYFSYVVLKPFILVILIAAVLVSILYPLYERLLTFLKNRESLAALLMTALVMLIIVIPSINVIILISQQSLEAFQLLERKYYEGSFSLDAISSRFDVLNGYLGAYEINIEKYVLDITSSINSFLISSTKEFVRGATQFFTDFLLVILTMFFFFRDGKRMMQRIMKLTPLSDRYDTEIYKTFHVMSRSTVTSTLLVALAQGVTGAFGFAVVGIPGALFWGVAMAFLSIIPLIGPFVLWFPAAILFLVLGRWWEGIFTMLWGGLVVSTIDNILRPLLITGKTEVNTLFIFFSILGGISAFGFWGLVFGPMILSLTLTLFHIYELEYREILEK
ncbi:MAG: AI-2E family transporter [Parcubacteria group bacterium]|nr:AI-2E family transporter [Parcubacteria group bacterium]